MRLTLSLENSLAIPADRSRVLRDLLLFRSASITKARRRCTLGWHANSDMDAEVLLAPRFSAVKDGLETMPGSWSCDRLTMPRTASYIQSMLSGPD